MFELFISKELNKTSEDTHYLESLQVPNNSNERISFYLCFLSKA